MGFNLPPFWLQNKEVVQRIKENEISVQSIDDISRHSSDDIKEAVLNRPFFDPMRFKWEDEPDDAWWQLPFDPVVSVTGKNTLIRRNVLKVNNDNENRRGSVKELWSQDDYEVNIAGVLIGNNIFPEDELRKLRQYLEARKVLMVYSELLCVFGIERIAIEDYSLPFTKGIENQMYTIKGYSDNLFDLLVES